VQNRLLALVADVVSNEHFEQKRNNTLSIIGSKIGYRHNGDAYLMRQQLLAAMYCNNPMKYDFLGSEESLQSINLNHVDLARDLIRTNIVSVMVFGPRISVLPRFP
jgi:predicted Zn-dependent peptidase